MDTDAAARAVYRAPLRSRDDDVAPGPAVEHALAQGVCGIGGRVSPAPHTLREAVAAVAAQHHERVARRLERFAEAPDGAYVWTRDVDGLYWVGRLAGAWRYDASPAAAAVDLVHVRACAWRADPVAPADVPAAVRATFARGGRNWQRIHAAGVAEATARVASS